MKRFSKSAKRLGLVLIAVLALPSALFAADEIKIGVLFPSPEERLQPDVSFVRGPNWPPTLPTTPCPTST